MGASEHAEGVFGMVNMDRGLAAPDTAAWPGTPAPPGVLTSPLLERIRRGVIGEGELMDGPFGPRRVTYADYTASGRSLDFIENFIRDAVLPRYANTHTESSGIGLQTTRLREEARQIIRDAVGGTADDLVIFCGSGATAAVNKLIGIMELRVPAGLDQRYKLAERIPDAERPVVFVGPYEHHSNELPWRESIADVVVIGEDADGHIDLADLRSKLIRYARRPLVIGSFSAASNVTGILTGTRAVAALLHSHGALSFWDYAEARGGCSCAGPCGHRLLAIGPARSHAPRKEIGHGCDGVKPGWTRVNLNYFISAATAGYIAAAVELIAAEGYRLLPYYRFDPRTGYLRQARAVLAALPPHLDDGPTELSPEFEVLRWFPLPPACLAGPV